MKYKCKTCNNIVDDINYTSQKDGYIITIGCWFYCDSCDEYSQQVDVVY